MTITSSPLRFFLYPLLALFGLLLMAGAMLAMLFVLLYPNLPSLEVLTDYHPKIPLRVYSTEGKLLAEFGEERRALIRIQEVPAVMKQAILAAEDDRFYQHSGIDALGVLRAAVVNVIGGGKKQGASTITQQVARNFFLSSEKTYTRKLYEILLAFKIERNLSKDQILELYLNQIFLGQRAYGFGAAAQIYFGKPLAQVSVAEAAMLASLPKAPSAYNPVVNPKRARIRQHYVLGRMHDLGFLNAAQLEKAKAEILVVKRDMGGFGGESGFVAEMARQIAAEQFPDGIYTRGLKVYTTINFEEQQAAFQSLRKAALDYDRRHGYRGAEAYIDMSEIQGDQDEAIDELLAERDGVDGLSPALVLAADAKSLKVYRAGGETLTFTGDALKWVGRMLDEKAPLTKRLRRGALIRLRQDDKGQWQIAQLPEVEAAFVALDPDSGAVRALVGGFDFGRNKFNHVTQAWRQPGSSFKPFIYSAALEKGFGPASMVSDEPITISAAETGSQAWTPHNYDGKYEGPMRLRTALARSRNMVSIRLLQAISPQYAQDYAARFGFDADKHPPYLTMALGSGSVTPWQMVSAYAVFANGGVRVNPFVVREIRDEKGQLLAAAPPAPEEKERVVDARNAFLMDSMLRDVTIYGTAAKASVALKRQDLAGKTGTTNEYVDAWFCGYQRTVVGCAWMGFDQPKKLGSGETGGAAALPIWIGYMQRALRDVPVSLPTAPEGLVASGKGDYLYQENVRPAPESPEGAAESAPAPNPQLEKPPVD